MLSNTNDLPVAPLYSANSRPRAQTAAFVQPSVSPCHHSACSFGPASVILAIVFPILYGTPSEEPLTAASATRIDLVPLISWLLEPAGAVLECPRAAALGP